MRPTPSSFFYDLAIFLTTVKKYWVRTFNWEMFVLIIQTVLNTICVCHDLCKTNLLLDLTNKYSHDFLIFDISVPRGVQGRNAFLFPSSTGQEHFQGCSQEQVGLFCIVV